MSHLSGMDTALALQFALQSPGPQNADLKARIRELIDRSYLLEVRHLPQTFARILHEPDLEQKVEEVIADLNRRQDERREAQARQARNEEDQKVLRDSVATLIRRA